MAWYEHSPALLVLLPLVTAFILTPLARRIRLVEGLVVASGVLLAAGAGLLAAWLMTGDRSPLVYHMGGWAPPWGIALEAGPLSAFFLLAIALVSLPVSLFSVNNLSEEVGDAGRVTRFHVLYLLLVGALVGMAFTKDLFNIFVLVEVATLSCCGLVSARKHPLAADAAFRYLILATIGSTFVLWGIGYVYLVTGHLNIGFASAELARIWQERPRVIWMAFSLMLAGFGVKSALFPLHIWLPDAHSSAPTPASAILSGLAVKGYMLCLLKVLYTVFGQTLMQHYTVHHILLAAGSIAILAGSVSALCQQELKRRLAYSTVAQVGYIFLGLGMMNLDGLTGGLFYLLSHALSKAVLFLSAGALLAVSGKKKVADLAGLGRTMPVAAAAFTISSLSLIGIPLFSGFVGKWRLLLGGLAAGQPLTLLVLVLGSLLCAAYLLPVVRILYSEPQPGQAGQDPGLPQRVALVFLSAMIILLGVFPGVFLELAQRAAVDLLAGR